MADKAELLAEAYRRGLLPPDRKAAYEEAARRGLVPPIGKAKPAMKNGRLPGELPFLPSAGSMANFNRGLGVGDELEAGFNTALDVVTGKVKGGKTREFLGNVGSAFAGNMQAQREREDTYAQQRPNTAALARGTGMAATIAVPSASTANALAQAPRLVNAARGAVVAGTEGAAYGLVDRGSAAERLETAGRTARDPLTLGLGAAAGSLATAARPKPTKAPKPQAVPLDQLRAAKTAAYQAVDNAGVSYKPEAIASMVDDIGREVAKANISATRHPKAASMVGDLAGLRDKPMTLTELDQLRQVVRRDVASASDPAEKFFGRRIIDRIDNFIEKAGPDAVNSGTAGDAPGLLAKARDLNGRVRKTEAVEGAVEKARLRAGSTGSGGNIDNAVRQNLRVVLEKTPNLSAEEKAALELVVLGGKGQNALRLAGKLSPSGNGLMATMHAIATGGATLAAGPVGFGLGMVPGTIGLASKALADRQTQKNVAKVLQVISSDNATAAQLAAVQRQIAAMPTSPAVTALRRAAAAKLARVAGVQGGGRSSDAVRQSGNALASARP
jgi:hypothetical protein